MLVIGGGPAGATAAGLLASWGWSVKLLHDEARGPSLAESLPAGTRKLFEFLGQSELIEAAHFYPNDGNVSDWAGRHTTSTTDTHGYHVPRPVFDRVLRRFARLSGASLVGGRVDSVTGSSPFHIACSRRSGGRVTYQARYVLDCSGRVGVAARRGFRRQAGGYRTLAIVAEWDCRSGWPADEASHTFVESYRDGWAWSVPLSRRRRQCTVMVEPSRAGEKTDLRSAYARYLDKAGAMTRRLQGARQVTRPWACDASPYDAEPAADSGLLLVGDAVSFIDPLSSGGVRKALLSAWRAAVVAHTGLTKPGMAGAAVDLYNRRERIVYAACRRHAAGFFDSALAEYKHAFWTGRASQGPEIPAGFGHEIADAELARDEMVRAEFGSLRDASVFRLRPGGALRFESVPSIEGHEVLMREAIVVPRVGFPIRFAAGVNLPELVRLAPHVRDLPGLVQAYRRVVGAAAPAELLLGLSMLLAHQVLVRDEAPPG